MPGKLTVVLVCVLVLAAALITPISVKLHYLNKHFLSIKLGSDYDNERRVLLTEYPGTIMKGKEDDSELIVIQYGNFGFAKTIAISRSADHKTDFKGSATTMCYFLEYHQFENDTRGLLTSFHWRW